MSLSNDDIKNRVDTLRQTVEETPDLTPEQLRVTCVGLDLLENLLQNLNDVARAATDSLRRS